MSVLKIDMSFATNALRRHQAALDRTLERLATGKRINRASDDPAGMMRAELLMFDIRTIEKNIEAGELATYFVGAADGALSVLGEMLIELKGLVVMAANRAGMSQSELNGLQIQADGILDGISHLMNTSVFRGERLLAEGFGVRVGSHGIAMRGMSLSGLGRTAPETDPKGQPGTHSGRTFNIASLRTGGALNLISGDLELAGQSVQAAINEIAMRRADIGAQLNGIHSDMNVWQVELQSLVGAHSDLVDLDYAKEVSQMVRTQLMRDAALFAVRIGRENAQRSLALLLKMSEPAPSKRPLSPGIAA
ncbi:MAG: hypothetical protein IH985_00270 [Planctomycetes bacterium]|nr:hypothetical protein [Planctomycetota bacterium]